MLTLLASAKINLFLHILGKRPNGYHELQSLIFFVDIGDTLSVKVAACNVLTADGEYAGHLPPPEENLILLALEALQKKYPGIPCLQVHLQKKLPIASGIGGGSSDAAAVLRAAIALSPFPVAAESLQGLLLTLGAELPVCYAAQPALVTGIGERITHWPQLPQWGVVLVNPLIPLPTQAVFAAMQPSQFCISQEFSVPQNTQEWKDLAMKTQNNMTEAAAGRVPEINEILTALQTIPECFMARMSGSGATCFGLCESRESALQVAQKIRAKYPQWWVEAGGIYHGQ